MYADTVTDSMKAALDETNRRREKQEAYNKEHGIDPQPLRKKIADVTDMLAREVIDTESLLAGGYRKPKAKRSQNDGSLPPVAERGSLPEAESDLIELIQELTDQMLLAAEELRFEIAARLRDEIKDLKRELRGMQAARH